ncbi:MAG: VWA domain-containing protein [Muribaculaceae bacterium]|nr:VWA domain-containing protein [Muribaculaceae bacterium]
MNKYDAQIDYKNNDCFGKLDLIIAFDTTGSMSEYIETVRDGVATLIPELFRDNEDLKLGIVAFGDYCDMNGPEDFGNAYQCYKLSSNKGRLIQFVRQTKDTNGGDAPEFYELVIRKIVNETHWREGASRSVLLIGDSVPHSDGVINWWIEARKAAMQKVRFDTVEIEPQKWMKELSAITGGRSIPFSSSSHTLALIKASVLSRGSSVARAKFDAMLATATDDETIEILRAYQKDRVAK